MSTTIKNNIIDKIMKHPLCGGLTEDGIDLRTGKAKRFIIYTTKKGKDGKFIALSANITTIMTEEQTLNGMLQILNEGNF